MPTTPTTAPVPLIGLAHGSRDPGAARVIADLMVAVASARPGLRTAAAFLDLTDPDLTAAMQELDAPEVVVLPLLFTQAFHARVDTPQAVRQACETTASSAVVGEILGLGSAVRTALEVRAAEAGIADDAPIALAAVGSADEEANAAVAAFAQGWGTRRAAPVTACFATAGEPKVAAAVDGLRGRGGIVPLFLAPGLLLRTITSHAGGLPVAEPIGVLLAELVLRRYDEAVRGPFGRTGVGS